MKGAKPAQLPRELPARFVRVTHLGAANEPGVPVPLSILLRADRVIE